MKKNKMMRAASGLLVATLLTTSIISGTFAKYTTEASGSDTARVAKWGVTALVSGDLFGSDYVDSTSNEISASYTGSVDIASPATDNSEKIVAPGTQNTTGVTISISGTPEVANKVTFSNTANQNKDIYLKAGSYATMVKATGVTADNFGAKTYYIESNGTYTKATQYSDENKDSYYVAQDAVTLGTDYYPIVWTLKDNEANGTTTTYTNVADLAQKLSTELTTVQDNQSLAKIDKSYTITWAWAITNTATDADKADTILGNIIASDTDAVAVKKSDNGDTYAAPVDTTDYSTNIAFNYSIKVEQVD